MSTRRDRPGRRRTTVALLVTVGILLAVGAGEIAYLIRDHEPTVSVQRPVVTGELTYRAAVEAAAGSTEDILSTTYDGYDEQVEEATSQMTDTFAEQYRETSAGIRDEFLHGKTELQVKVVAQGVVDASSEQVRALLFLDQYVQKVTKGEPRTDFRQYRALVTVVRAESGWLVADLQTQ
jgi:Mce-associated membrane protein